MLRNSLLLIAAVLLIGGCSRDKAVRCTVSIGYLDAPSGAQLRVPGDLSLPDNADALVVPGPSVPGESAAAGSCLEYSPALEAMPAAEQED